LNNCLFFLPGEPLDNYTNVTAACRALIDPKRWNLAHHCVTVSTVGLVSQMRKLTADLPQVSLALSLHAPNQVARQAIVPTASRYPIEQLIDALDNHMTTYKHKRRSDGSIVSEFTKLPMKRKAMIEYVMLDGPTSTLECAHELGQLCQGRNLIVNLIPYNSTNVKDLLHCPSEKHMQEFRRIVSSYKVFCTIRRTMGADIDSACEQLVQVVKEKQQHGDSASVVDIEDVVRSSKVASNVVAKSQPLPSNSTAPAAPDEKKRPPRNWMDSESMIFPLTVATALSASCFLLSLVHYTRPRRP
jgi:adenine C2-methylase RlmN of 23S rRNA A2503 and tRNA A37